MEGLRTDLTLALRLLRKAPQLSAAAVLTLGLGLGANAAIFGVVDAVLLRASPFVEPDRLVMVWETDRASGTSHEPASWPDVVDLRERSRALSGLGAFVAGAATLTGSGDAERVALLAVTPEVPALLGVRPLLGRGFTADEGRPGGPRVALLAEELWRRRFAADPRVVGSRLVLDGEPTTVVGVLPAAADLGIRQVHARADYGVPLAGPEVELWLARVPDATEFPRQTHPFFALGRLAPGATVEQAQQELAAVMAGLERQYPENAARGVHVQPYEEVTFGAVRPALWVLLGSVALVLLVACVNVANLVLVRAVARSPELAVRRALGAPLRQLARQFLVESAVLTGLGGLAGVAIAHAGLGLLVALAPSEIPRLAEARVDGRVLAITFAVAAAVAVLFALAPLLRAGAADLHREMRRQGGRGATGGRAALRLQRTLVVAEVAVAVALAIGAGLLLRSLHALLSVDPGFRTASVVKAEYQLPESRYPLDYDRWPELPEIHGFNGELLRRVEALPGITAAAIAARHPLDPGFTNSFAVVGREAEAADWPEIRCRFVSPGYFATLDVPVVAGRALAAGDVAGANPVAVVNRAAVARYFAGGDPLGQRLQFWGIPWQIVGVVGDERFLGLDEEPEPAVYASVAQAPQQAGVLLVRTGGDPQALVGPLRRVVRELDPGVALHGIEPLAATVAASVARPRFTATLLALFGAVAVALALVGVHGVLSYTVAQRRREVAVRMALGATRGQVTGLVLRQGAGLAGLGAVLGVGAALAGSRVLASLVFGVGPRDAATFAVAAAGPLALALLASWLPARRAARADALEALRPE